MSSVWVVRLRSDDGTSIEGQLTVDAYTVTFRPGISGHTVPALVIDRTQITRVDRRDREFLHQVEVTLLDGRILVFDNGVRPTDDLTELLTL